VESSKRKVQSAVAAIVAALLTTTLGAQDKGVKTSNAWVKLPVAGEANATAFLTIENAGMYEVNVIAAKSDAAGKVELRDGGQAVTFITVPAYGRVDMSPAGVHLVLLDMKQPIKEGDALTLTLSTDVDITLTVAARVRKE
jgi:copper(I)-binding protein